MSRAGRALVVLVLAACGDSTPAPVASAGPSASTAAGATSAAAAPSDSASSAAGPSAKQVAAALAEGRRLAKDGKWPEAVAALSPLADLSPPNGIALSELGWAALNANDLELAEKSTQRGLGVVTEPRIKASILYNQGRVREAKGDKEGAKTSYEASIALRPNDVVKKRLSDLGAVASASASAPPAPPPPEEKPVCAQSFPTVAAACGCLSGAGPALGMGDGTPSCAAVAFEGDDRPAEVVKLELEGQSLHWLLVDVAGRLTPLFRIEGEDIAVKRVTFPIKGASDVLGLVYERSSTETGKTVRSTLEILCALPPRVPAARCPLEVPNAVSELARGQIDPDRTATFVRRVRPDGTVEVKQQGGPKDLWLRPLDGGPKLF